MLINSRHFIMNAFFDNVVMPRECLKGNLPIDIYCPSCLNREKFSFGFTRDDHRRFVAMQVDIDGKKRHQYFCQSRRSFLPSDWASELKYDHFIDEGYFLSQAQIELLTDLYEGKTVVLTKKHRAVPILIGKSVKMC